MASYTRYNNSLSPDFYLAHRDYFDSRLILTLEKSNEKIHSLNEQIEFYKACDFKNKSMIKNLKFKNNDMETVCANLKQKLQDKEEETNEIIKDFEKKIEEMDKTINNELQISYKTNVKLQKEIEKLKKENAKLNRENKKYKRSAKQNSNNSSIPSSQSEFKTIKNSREPSSKSKGGQVGHKAHRSSMTAKPDQVIYKTTVKAPKGAVAVFNDENEIVYYATQEINAYLKTRVVETRYLISDSFEKLSEKEMRKYAINSVTYHDDFKSMVLYLNSKGTIALKRLCVMINEMSKGVINLKPSTVVNWGKEFRKKSEPYIAELLAALKKEKVLHVDETGWKINGKRAWLHVIVSNNMAYFIVTEKRNDKVTGPLKILEDYEGCLVHDHYKQYYKLLKCLHGECNAHVLRYLLAGKDLDKNEACGVMIKLLQEMIHTKKELISKGIFKMEDTQIKEYEEQYLKILTEELEKYAKEHPVKVAGKYKPEYIKLMKRMKEYCEEHLRFIKDFNVPADNNIAERQMRPTKAKKKISGQSLNLERANDFAAINTVIQTCSLQGKNTLEEIKAILQS